MLNDPFDSNVKKGKGNWQLDLNIWEMVCKTTSQVLVKNQYLTFCSSHKLYPTKLRGWWEAILINIFKIVLVNDILCYSGILLFVYSVRKKSVCK